MIAQFGALIRNAWLETSRWGVRWRRSQSLMCLQLLSVFMTSFWPSNCANVKQVLKSCRRWWRHSTHVTSSVRCEDHGHRMMKVSIRKGMWPHRHREQCVLHNFNMDPFLIKIFSIFIIMIPRSLYDVWRPAGFLFDVRTTRQHRAGAQRAMILSCVQKLKIFFF